MSTRQLFATTVYTARLHPTGAPFFNRRLLRECWQIRADDQAGQRWSRRNYPGGYTSYGSLCQLQQLTPGFETLQRALDPHAQRFAKSLALDLTGRKLVMTDCWINIMPNAVVHTSHLHPLSTLSGTYYVQTPRGCPGLRLEDPRLGLMMTAPPRRADCAESQRQWVTLPARAGALILFESWLRHEVPPNTVAGERVSVSFNYHWR